MKGNIQLVLGIISSFVLLAFIMLAVVAFSGCGLGSGKEDDTSVTAPQSSSVTEDNGCPVTIEAPSAEEAVDAAEEDTGGEATAVEEVESGLDQGSVLRVFRVWLKDITINVNGCHNGVVVNDNDSFSDDDTTVDLGEQPQ